MPSFASTETNSGKWPQDVGIIAMEVYFPSAYVDQTELESFDGVSAGKYTIGLGQSKMGFCTDREDINSLCLTVVQNLIERNQVSYEDIGRLEVGTETIIDKSKSVKTNLMQLFEDSGNYNVEGIDTTNACYGGTQALFNALAWVESSAWDGRYALVVAGDIAVYATGNARPTGGAGAIAMLVGPDAPIIVERGVRYSHMQHAYDFYKPDMSSEYPTVDGKLSIQCYLSALDKCYQGYCKKAKTALLKGLQGVYGSNGVSHSDTEVEQFSLDLFDAVCFHSPYCKLVQKSLARLALNDFIQDPSPDTSDGGKYSGLQGYKDLKLDETFFDRDVEKAFMTYSKTLFETKTKPALLVANQVGNMYTPSLYGGLASILSSYNLDNIPGRRIGMFSYGSGFASTLFSLKVCDDNSPGSPLWKVMVSLQDLQERLDSRKCVEPSVFAEAMKLRQDTHHLSKYTPVGSIDDLFPGTWYLTYVDDMYRRQYTRKPTSALPSPIATSAPINQVESLQENSAPHKKHVESAISMEQQQSTSTS